MRKNREALNLECVLTREEKEHYSLELAEAISKTNRIADAAKSAAASYKADIEELKGRINSLSQKISTGKEYRDVECKIERDWSAGTREWVRLDTFEVAKQDIIPEYERQEQLKLEKEEEKKTKNEEAIESAAEEIAEKVMEKFEERTGSSDPTDDPDNPAGQTPGE